MLSVLLILYQFQYLLTEQQRNLAKNYSKLLMIILIFAQEWSSSMLNMFFVLIFDNLYVFIFYFLFLLKQRTRLAQTNLSRDKLLWTFRTQGIPLGSSQKFEILIFFIIWSFILWWNIINFIDKYYLMMTWISLNPWTLINWSYSILYKWHLVYVAYLFYLLYYFRLLFYLV